METGTSRPIVLDVLCAICAAQRELSRASTFQSPERRASYSNIFSTLLFTIALKSDLEGLEGYAPVSPALQPYEHWIGPATLVCVLIGLGVTIIRGKNVPIPWPELHLRLRDKIVLSGLFALYLAIVVASLSVAHRVQIPAPVTMLM